MTGAAVWKMTSYDYVKKLWGRDSRTFRNSLAVATCSNIACRVTKLSVSTMYLKDFENSTKKKWDTLDTTSRLDHEKLKPRDLS